jgi:hypothetical protein
MNLKQTITPETPSFQAFIARRVRIRKIVKRKRTFIPVFRLNETRENHLVFANNKFFFLFRLKHKLGYILDLNYVVIFFRPEELGQHHCRSVACFKLDLLPFKNFLILFVCVRFHFYEIFKKLCSNPLESGLPAV